MLYSAQKSQTLGICFFTLTRTLYIQWNFIQLLSWTKLDSSIACLEQALQPFPPWSPIFPRVVVSENQEWRRSNWYLNLFVNYPDVFGLFLRQFTAPEVHSVGHIERETGLAVRATAL